MVAITHQEHRKDDRKPTPGWHPLTRIRQLLKIIHKRGSSPPKRDSSRFNLGNIHPDIKIRLWLATTQIILGNTKFHRVKAPCLRLRDIIRQRPCLHRGSHPHQPVPKLPRDLRQALLQP